MKYVLDGKKMLSREDAHVYLQEVFAFPQHYGKNLDALSDCLAELGEIEAEIHHTAEMLNVLGKYGEGILRVFSEMETLHIEVK